MVEVKYILSGKKQSIAIDRDVMSAVFKEKGEPKEILMAPGLFDIQVNGYKAIDFNDHDLTIAKIEEVVEALLKDGVTRFLPTLITNDPAIIEKNLDVLNRAISGSALIRSCIPGIHLEGPFLSDQEGYSGAHDKKWMRNPDWSLFEKWQHISGNNIKLVTLAPERDGSMDFIRLCAGNGVKVAIGHSAAGAEVIGEALANGANLSTHLGNAMPHYVHRHKNVLVDHLAEEKLFASIIADGHHLPDNRIKVILKLKQDKLILVSDSTKFSSMEAGIYDTVIGGKVILKENRELAVYDKEGYLAGSASSLVQCVNYLSRANLLSLPDAWKAASVAPINYMNNITLQAGYSDVVLFSYDSDKIDILVAMKDNQYYF